MICKTDTHYYDGKLWSDSDSSDVKEDHKQMLKRLKEDIEAVKKMNKEDKLQVFNNLLSFIATDEEASQCRTARACINTIVRDFEINPTYGSGPNYDPKNELQADDLLYLCAGKILSEEENEFTRDFISVFMMQCEDMRTGMCPQGRTTRLFQTLIMMSNNGV